MDDSVLAEVFGNRTVLAVADVLMDHHSLDYSKKDLAEVTGVSEATIHRHWAAVESAGIVKESRNYGNATLYTLDQDSEVVRALYELDQALRDRVEELQVVEV